MDLMSIITQFRFPNGLVHCVLEQECRNSLHPKACKIHLQHSSIDECQQQLPLEI